MTRDSPRIPDVRKRKRYTSSSYTTALYQAACGGADSIVEMLIQHGVDIDATDCGEYGSALAGAAVAGHASIIKRLIEHGVEINARSKYGNALQTLIDEKTSIYLARPKTLEVVELLVQHGAHICASGGRKGHSALKMASRGDDKTGRIFSVLLKHGTGVDTKSEEFISALREVSHRSHVSCETLGSDPRWLLQAASWLGHAALVTLLLQHCLDRDQALGFASSKGHEAVVKVLLRYGVTVSGKWRAMQWASEAGHEASYKLLLDHKNAINDDDELDSDVDDSMHDEPYVSLLPTHRLWDWPGPSSGTHILPKIKALSPPRQLALNKSPKPFVQIFRGQHIYDVPNWAKSKQNTTTIPFRLISGQAADGA
ncbi:ankyrin repeat-containing domain protein [Mycena galopus ATCC 62051]|nr:ankyrin repeat-containing domain protein [Mycena galopus ATCC 62051]